jgi:hypothetical protein
MKIALYHITHPERVNAIREEGFNDNKKSQSHSLHDDPTWYRTFLTRKRNLAKWLRILSKENAWPTLTILEITMPTKVYNALLIKNIEERNGKEVYLMDWGDQLVLDSRHPVKPEGINTHLKVLRTVKNPYLQGIRVTMRNLNRFLAKEGCTKQELGRNPFKPWSDRNITLRDLQNGAFTTLSNGLPVSVYLLSSQKIQEEIAPWRQSAEMTIAALPCDIIVIRAEIDDKPIYLIHRLGERANVVSSYWMSYGALAQLSELPIRDLCKGRSYIVYQGEFYYTLSPNAKPLIAAIEWRVDPRIAPLFGERIHS